MAEPYTGVRFGDYDRFIMLCDQGRAEGAERIMKIELSRLAPLSAYYPSERIERAVLKLLAILETHGVGLGFEFGLDDEEQSARELLIVTIRETERLRKILQEAALKLGLEYPDAPPTGLSPPGQSNGSAPLPEAQLPVSV
jgi:hypothetical protein